VHWLLYREQSAASLDAADNRQGSGQEDLPVKPFHGSPDKVNIKAQVVPGPCVPAHRVRRVVLLCWLQSPRTKISKTGTAVQVVFDACWRRLEEEHKDVRAPHAPLVPLHDPAINH